MLKLRRPTHETRIEIMPLIDVIFLLLTFFIYAMVLLVPVKILPMEYQAFASAKRAEPGPVVTISISLDGSLHFDREPVELDDVLARIEAARAENPETEVYLALEDGAGSADRAPLLTALWDRLANQGLDIKFVGRPSG